MNRFKDELAQQSDQFKKYGTEELKTENSNLRENSELPWATMKRFGAFLVLDDAFISFNTTTICN